MENSSKRRGSSDSLTAKNLRDDLQTTDSLDPSNEFIVPGENLLPEERLVVDFEINDTDEGENREYVTKLFENSGLGKLPRNLELKELVETRQNRIGIWKEALKRENKILEEYDGKNEIEKEKNTALKTSSVRERRNSVAPVDPEIVNQVFKRANLPSLSLPTALQASGVVAKAKKNIYEEERARRLHGYASIIPFDVRKALDIAFNTPIQEEETVYFQPVTTNTQNVTTWLGNQSTFEEKQTSNDCGVKGLSNAACEGLSQSEFGLLNSERNTPTISRDEKHESKEISSKSKTKREENALDTAQVHLANTIPSLPKKKLTVCRTEGRSTFKAIGDGEGRKDIKELFLAMGKRGELHEKEIISLFAGADADLMKNVTIDLLEDFVEELHWETDIMEKIAFANEKSNFFRLIEWACHVLSIENAKILRNVQSLLSEAALLDKKVTMNLRDEVLLAQYCQLAKAIIVIDNIDDPNTIWHHILNDPIATRNAICIPLFNRNNQSVSAVMVFRNHFRQGYKSNRVVSKWEKDFDSANFTKFSKIGACGQMKIIAFETPLSARLQVNGHSQKQRVSMAPKSELHRRKTIFRSQYNKPNSTKEIAENLKTYYEFWTDADIVMAKCIANLAFALPESKSVDDRFKNNTAETTCDYNHFEELLLTEKLSHFSVNCYRGDDILMLTQSIEALLLQIVGAHRVTFLLSQDLQPPDQKARNGFWVPRACVNIAGIDQLESLIERKEDTVSALERSAVEASSHVSEDINEIMNAFGEMNPFKAWVILQVPGQNSGIRSRKKIGGVDVSKNAGSWSFKRNSHCARAIRYMEALSIEYTDIPESSYKTEGLRIPRSWKTTSEMYIPITASNKALEYNGNRHNEERTVLLGLLRIERDIVLKKANEGYNIDSSTPCFNEWEFEGSKLIAKTVSNLMSKSIKSNRLKKIIRRKTDESRVKTSQARRRCLLYFRVAHALEELSLCTDMKSLVQVASTHISRLFEKSSNEVSEIGDSYPDMKDVFRYNKEFKDSLDTVEVHNPKEKPASAWYKDKDLEVPSEIQWEDGYIDLKNVDGFAATTVICDIALPCKNNKRKTKIENELYAIFAPDNIPENAKMALDPSVGDSAQMRNRRKSRKSSRGDLTDNGAVLEFSHILPSPIEGGGLIEEVYTENGFRFPELEINSAQNINNSEANNEKAQRKKSHTKRKSTIAVPNDHVEFYQFGAKKSDYTLLKSPLAEFVKSEEGSVAAYSPRSSKQAIMVACLKPSTSDKAGMLGSSNFDNTEPNSGENKLVATGPAIFDPFVEEDQETVVFGIPLILNKGDKEEGVGDVDSFLGVLRIRFSIAKNEEDEDDPNKKRLTTREEQLAVGIPRAFSEVELSGVFETKWLEMIAEFVAMSLVRIQKLQMARNSAVTAKSWRENLLRNIDGVCNDGVYFHLELTGKSERSTLVNRNAKTTAEIMAIAEASQIPLGMIASGDLRKLTGNNAMPAKNSFGKYGHNEDEDLVPDSISRRRRRQSRKVSVASLGRDERFNIAKTPRGHIQNNHIRVRDYQLKTRVISDEEHFGRNVVPTAGILMEQVAQFLGMTKFAIYLNAEYDIGSPERDEYSFIKMYDSEDKHHQWGLEIQENKNQNFGNLSLYADRKKSGSNRESKAKLVTQQIRKEANEAILENYQKTLGARTFTSKSVIRHSQDLGHGIQIKYIAVPLMLTDTNQKTKHLGFVSFVESAISDVDLIMVREYANLAALDVHNWLCYKENARELFRSNLLYETSRILSVASSNSNLNKSLHRIGNAACKAISCEYSVTFLPDEDGLYGNTTAAKSHYIGLGLTENENIFSTPKERIHIDINKDFTSTITQALRRNQRVRASIWDAEYRYREPESDHNLNPHVDSKFRIHSKSICVLPLVSTANRQLGVIMFINKFKEKPAFLHNPKVQDLIPNVPEKCNETGLSADDVSDTDSDYLSDISTKDSGTYAIETVTSFSDADYEHLEKFASIASLATQWYQEAQSKNQIV